MDKEIWLEILGFPDYYISNHGLVRTLIPRNRNSKPPEIPRYLKINITANGYCRVSIRKKSENNKSKSLFIHSLVLTTFKGPRPLGMQCCHKDGIKTNNYIHNLRWGTPSENTIDQVKHGVHGGLKRVGELHPNSKLSDKQVLDIKNRVKPENRVKQFL